jgi:anti-sigma B factor antagonist
MYAMSAVGPDDRPGTGAPTEVAAMSDRYSFDTGAGSVELVVEPTRLRVIAVGDVDYEAGPHLDAICSEVTDRQPADVLVDLDRTTFLDSVGLGFVVRLHQAVTRNGAKLVVVASRPQVRRMFGLTGLDRVLTIATQPSEQLYTP